MQMTAYALVFGSFETAVIFVRAQTLSMRLPSACMKLMNFF